MDGSDHRIQLNSVIVFVVELKMFFFFDNFALKMFSTPKTSFIF